MSKRQDDNDLLKSIEQHIDVEKTDYSGWSRKQRMDRHDLPKTTLEITKRSDREGHGSACSSRCFHGDKKTRNVENSRETIAKEHRIKELQLKVDLYKQNLLNLQQRREAMLGRNFVKSDKIDSDEQASHKHINGTLQKYERCRDGISVLNQRYGKDIEIMKKEVAAQKTKLNNNLQKLRKEVELASKRVQEVHNELLLLNDYKDKEYPLKVIQIRELEQKLQNMTFDNEDDEADLLDIIENEHRQLKDNQEQMYADIRSKVAEEVLSQMHPSLRKMSDQNQKMMQDILFHRETNDLFRQEIEELERRNKQLINDSQTHVRQHMFPEVCKVTKLCSPDEDVILDIPIKKELPI